MGTAKEILKLKTFQDLCKDVNKFVESKLSGYTPPITGGKVIHDPVWGSVEYATWEMQIIDTPLFQRLRDICQVGLAMLTYPSARHSRFEHSLGVASAAKLMCEKIDRNTQEFRLEEETRNTIILAALLHDIGHCFYSHLSESIYGSFEFLDGLRRDITKILLLKPKPHEILSFVVVNTPAFKKFFKDYISFPQKEILGDGLFLDIGCMIIGANIKKGQKIHSYQTSIINGPFDADKLDYIKRDSVTAGLALQYDMERLFTKLRVFHEVVNGEIECKLVIDLNGVTAIEELTFCKIMLFSYIYYHHKVLVSEALVRDYVFGLCELGLLNNCSDFLKYTDSDILSLAESAKGYKPFPDYGDLDLIELAANIKNRRLPKRCFEISQNNIDINENCDKTMDYFVKPFLKASFTDLLDIRRNFYEQLVKKYKEKGRKVNFSMFDIYIIFPDTAYYGTGDDKVVLGRDQKHLITINQFIKLDPWAEAFKSNKWRGYIFVSEKIDNQIAYEVSCEFVFKGEAKLSNPSLYIKGILE